VTAPHLFLIAGEPSGDLLGGALLEGLQEIRGPALRIEGVGGPAMAAQGMPSLFPMEELSVMGIAEVLPRAPNLLRRIRQTADAIIAARPDALITIDSPDFCLRVARKARAALPDLRIIHYVAPSVWAWRPGRAAKMARHVDHVLALLPFEPPYMEAAGMTCDFVGHPVVSEPQATPAEIADIRADLGIRPDQRLLVALPGSRRGEVSRHAPIFADVIRRLRAESPDLAVIVPAAGAVAGLSAGLLTPDADGWPRVLDPTGVDAATSQVRKRAVFAAADVALAVSGTVSLELAAAGTPMVIAYSANPISAWLARRLVRIDTVTLVNLVTDTRTVPEFLLGDCTPDRITPAIRALLDDSAASSAQRTAGARTMELLGRGEDRPGLRAARSVLAAIAPDASAT
jgi:lipid-A-disaccharide synthase